MVKSKSNGTKKKEKYFPLPFFLPKKRKEKEKLVYFFFSLIVGMDRRRTMRNA
jgi:hypothetical protein